MSRPSDIRDWARAFKHVFWFSLTGMIVLAGYLFVLARDLPSLDQLEHYDPDLVTRIYSRDGEILHELFLEKRVFVGLDQIPPPMRNATVASEDRRFRDHWGISLRDFFRAVVINLIPPPKYRQGFSSITQQLARNLYDTIGFKKTIIRKIKEGITAVQIERTYTKNEILEMYLNSVHFGHGTYGVQAAAKRFFGVDAQDLEHDQAALLVGLLPAPGRYSPIRHPERALRRRNTILRLVHNQGYISAAEYDQARTINTLDGVQAESSRGQAPYFTEYVRRILEKEDQELGINIYRDGLKIYTTLDSRLQAIAEEVVMRTVQRNQGVLNKRLFEDEEEFSRLAYLAIYPADSIKMMLQQATQDSIDTLKLYPELRDKLLVQSAFVALDPRTGAILALVGGRPDYADQYNRAVQAPRQPGSVFKPFVYTAAIDNGYPVTKQLLNQPVVLNVQNADGEWEKWSPQNYDGSTGGPTTLREGIRNSINLIAIRVVQQLVPAQVVKNTAQRMGISTSIRAVDAIALGTSEVYLLDMVGAYATLTNQGVHNEPYAVIRIEDRYGNIVKEYSPRKEEVLRAETAYLMTELLQTVVDRGTGARTRWLYNFYRPAAGKTGTTQGWTDAWFVGFTPQLAAGVWFGVDDPQVSLGENQDGSRAALPAWAQFMGAAYDTLKLPRADFQRPAGILELSICSVSKDLPTQACPTETEIFIKGTEPTRRCRVHRQRR